MDMGVNADAAYVDVISTAADEYVVDPVTEDAPILIEASAIDNEPLWTQVRDAVLNRYDAFWEGRPADREHVAERTLDNIWEHGYGPIFVACTEAGQGYVPIGYEYSHSAELDFDRPEKWSGMEEFRKVVQSMDERGVNVSYVDHLVVDPSYRDQGVGTAIATLRQSYFERDWGNNSNVDEQLRWVPGSVRGEYDAPEAVVSLIRAKTKDGGKKEDSVVSRISDNLGFTQSRITDSSKTYRAVYKAREDVEPVAADLFGEKESY